MKREQIKVRYSYEHGDESLPKLKDMVSDNPDSDKETILSYLRTNCICGCPGIVNDEITEGKVIGAGHIFSDGTYVWDDVLANYIERYNIPLPKEFRTHILSNHSARGQRHDLLRCIDMLEIDNCPCPEYRFHVSIYRDGTIMYYSNSEKQEITKNQIDPEKAAYMINPIMSELFCYDSDNHGLPTVDGYHWKLSFYKDGKIIDTIEGWPNEDLWRYAKVKECFEYVERYIPYELGTNYMNSY